MMKKGKVLIKVLAIVITLFIGCNNVFALRTYSVGQKYTRRQGASVQQENNFVYNSNNKGDNVASKFYSHVGTSRATGQSEPMYCLDAALDATINDLKVQSVLNQYNPQDAALLYIMNINGSYNAKVTAIRILNQFTNNYSSFAMYKGTGHARGDKMAYGYVNTALKWLPSIESTKDVLGTGSYDGLKSIVSKRISNSSDWGKAVKFNYGEYVLNEDIATVQTAKAYVKEALDYAANVKDRYTTDGKDTRTMNVVTNNGGKNGVLENLVSSKKDASGKKVTEEVYFVVQFNNFDNKVFANEYLKMSNEAIPGFTITTEYKVVTDPKLSALKGSSGWKSFNPESTNFMNNFKNNVTYIAFKYTLNGTLTGSAGVTLKVRPNNGGSQFKYTGAYLVPVKNDHSQRFLVTDNTFEPANFEIEASFNLLGTVCEEPKTFTNKDKCEEYIKENKDGNSTFDEAWCNDKTLYCSPKRSCSDYSETKYKDYDIKTCADAVKDLNGKGSSDAAFAQCVGERLICSATCDSLLGEFQSKAEYKGDVGANTLKAILAVYDSLLNRDPKEAEKVKVNKQNSSDEHVVCHACEDYAGKTLGEAGFTSEEDIKYQVADPEDLFVYNGVIYCSSNFCELEPDTNNIDLYRNWIRRCCRTEAKKTVRDYNVEEECQKGDEKACETYQKYCSICDPKFDINNSCIDLDPGENAKMLTPEEYTSDNKGSITGPEAVKLCVIDEVTTVENKNEYKLSKESNVNNNPYCSVFCKEDMDFNIPKGRYTINGRYFSLSMDVTSTKTCYSNKIDYAKFESDYSAYYAEAQKYASNPNSTEFKNAQKALTDSINYINACSAGWSNDYKYEPEITFTYDEKEYIDMLPNKSLTFDLAKPLDEKIESWFCNGADVNNEYNQCISGSTSTVKNAKTVTSYLVDGTQTQVEVPEKVTYAKKSVTKGGLYTPQAVFYTKASTGVIKYSKDGKNLINYALIEDKKFVQEKGLEIAGTLPVRLSDDKGLYNYQFTFDKLGEYFDRNEAGRLISLGSQNNSDISNINNEFKGKYVCSYVVNCPECKPTCIDDPAKGIVCSLPDENNPEGCPPEGCNIKCSEQGCAYDSRYGLLYTVHQTSLIDLTNKDRTVGSNWDPDNNIKAAAAVAEIEAKGEDIYKTPEYSFEFTPAVITYLRGTGDNYISDETLSCKNKTVSSGESYLVCESSVLTELKNNFSAKTHLDGRTKIQSFLESDFCKNENNICSLVGTIGPAWK